MASCCVLSGLIFIALAFIASAIALVAPYWYMETGKDWNTGLWAKCEEGECEWFFQNDFQWEKKQGEWFYAVQGLFVLGVLSQILSFFIACCQLCCSCCKGGFSMVHIIIGLLLLSFLELAAAVVLFGVKCNQTRHVGINEDSKRYFHAAFWTGCGGSVLTLFACIFYMCEVCRARTHEGYTRGEVVS